MNIEDFIEKLEMSVTDFVEFYEDDIIELFETGSVTIMLGNGKEALISLNIEES